MNVIWRGVSVGNALKNDEEPLNTINYYNLKSLLYQDMNGLKFIYSI